MFDFTDRIALVTGASGALGSALIRRLTASGARVAALDRKPERLAGLFPEPTDSGRLTAFGADLASRAAVAAAVQAVVGALGRVDFAFNAVGAYEAGAPVDEATDEHWDEMFGANFAPVLQVCRAAVAQMRRQGGGTIVNVGSRSSLAGDARAAAYSIAKTAVLRLTESIAAEGRQSGVRAHCVLPGTLDTPANRTAMPNVDRSGWVELDAVADAMLFLASPAARGLRGVALPVFG
jgi:NAD(P)-dependent dehydrogenase (short-subunit alcohol dehydrogenase family)